MRNFSEDDFDEFEQGEKWDVWVQVLVTVVATVIVLLLAGSVYLLYLGGRKTETPASMEYTDPALTEDMDRVVEDALSSAAVPEGYADTTTATSDPTGLDTNGVSADVGATPSATRLVSNRTTETADVTTGIDVSHYQGIINWEKVANTDVRFAMIRVGQRLSDTGEIVKDVNAEYNLQQACKYGIQVGVYFFSTAINEEEALEEADWVADLIAPYPITYPVVYDCEGYQSEGHRQYSLSKEKRTEIAFAFLQHIYDAGYTPMFYASMGTLENDKEWLTSSLEASFKIWVSWYPPATLSEQNKPAYDGVYDMWQYSEKGVVDGISQNVDLNMAYFGYSSTASALEDRVVPEAFPVVEVLMSFIDVEETVTAKDVTNLRDIPSQGSDSTVLTTLQSGQTATRTGISNSGWSRLEYNGQVYYAVSNYLTTDLTPHMKEQGPQDDGIKTVFTSVNERVSPKIEVNLRTLPSVTNPDSVIAATIPYGTIITRTGINNEVGWSRVEYNGQTLYCVSSYVYAVEQE